MGATMTRNLEKYLHKQMDRQAGIEHTFHRTKIVATVGPACDTYEKMLELARAGVNVFRLNFSLGKNEDKTRILGLIDRMNKEEPFNVASLADLQGPKLRVCLLYTSDAADERSSVDLGGRRIIKKK